MSVSVPCSSRFAWRCWPCSSACSRPSLILRAAVPQQNFLGVLIDDSRSMILSPIARRSHAPTSSSSSSALMARWQGAVAALRAALPASIAEDRLAAPADLNYAGTSTGWARRSSAPATNCRDAVGRARHGHRRRRHVGHNAR